jgi:hypothetical protein
MPKSYQICGTSHVEQGERGTDLARKETWEGNEGGMKVKENEKGELIYVWACARTTGLGLA